MIDTTLYDKVPFYMYGTLSEKLQALLNGDILFIKGFEQKTESDVLIRVVDLKYTVSQISLDISIDPSNPRYWVTHNIGLIDLSLFSVFKFEENIFSQSNKYMINDKVEYVSTDGTKDAAIIEEVYVLKADPSKYAYKLSREPDTLYEEDKLIRYKYQ